MRDKKRIKLFTDELARIWETEAPDWRFGQFICNFERWYGGDIFFLEEDKMMELIHEYIQSFK